MPRVTEITDGAGNQILEGELAAEREIFGDVLNPSRVLAHCPPILTAAKKLYASIDESGLLPVTLLALVYARVAAINGCPF
jgi:alkylhydroperoxidase family enzyme